MRAIMPEYVLMESTRQERLVCTILKNLEVPNVTALGGSARANSATVALYVADGSFKRTTRFGATRRAHLAHVLSPHELEAGFIVRGITYPVPEWVRPALLYVAMRRLTVAELNDSEVHIRLMDTIREVNRCCRRRVRLMGQSKARYPSGLSSEAA